MNSKQILITISLCFLRALSLRAQTSVEVTALGAMPDGSNPTGTMKAFYAALNNNPRSRIVVPPGTYAIDNSLGAIYVNGFSGELDFEGGATLIFQYPSQGGLRFQNGTGARIHGLHGTYATPPSVRTIDEFSFTTMNDLTITDSIAENSPGMGFLMTLCVRPRLRNITVSHSLADGVAFANSQSAQINNYNSEYSADNGLAFYNYSYFQDWDGATANNLHILNVTGAHGIAVVGVSNVVVSNFLIDTTTGSSIWVGQDPVYQTRFPSRVVIQHGIINNAGITAPPNTNNFAIEYTNPDDVLFADIQISGSQNRAVTGLAPNSVIRFHNIRVSNNLSSDAFVIGVTGIVEMADCSSDNSPNSGFTFNGVTLLIVRNLRVVNASSQNSLHRAIWFENGSIVNAADLAVVDDRQTPAGFVVGASDNGSQIQFGSVQGIQSAIANGSLVVNKYSPNVHFSNTF